MGGGAITNLNFPIWVASPACHRELNMHRDGIRREVVGPQTVEETNSGRSARSNVGLGPF